MKHISASGVYDVFAVDVNNEVFHCRKQCVGEWMELNLNVQLTQCDATTDALFGVDNNLYKQRIPL